MSISKCKKKKNLSSSNSLVFISTGTHGLLVHGLLVTNGCPRHEGEKTRKTMFGASCVTVPWPCSSNLVLFECCRVSSCGTRAGSFPGRRKREKASRNGIYVLFKADRTTSKRIRYGFITIKSTTLIGLNSPRKNTTLPAIRFVEPRRTHIPV
ncbi:hypothetical protein TNCV_2202711 [Trichonephila clavipes]|nr:hypothetical protein TNCV_2202711 [Trichonephila clavipes]